jgi:hypothetical protein
MNGRRSCDASVALKIILKSQYNKKVLGDAHLFTFGCLISRLMGGVADVNNGMCGLRFKKVRECSP